MLFDYKGEGVREEENSVETNRLIMEGAMLDTMDSDDISMFLENMDEVNAAIGEEIVTEKTIRIEKTLFIQAKPPGNILLLLYQIILYF